MNVFYIRYSSSQSVMQISLFKYNAASNNFTVLEDWSKVSFSLAQVCIDYVLDHHILPTSECAQSKFIQATSLLPATLLQAQIFPTTLRGVESKVPYKNKNLKITCGCPVDEPTLRTTEPTGQPINIGVSQSRGKMYFSWTDTSLCENGFGFDRGGFSFTPDYKIESYSTCFTSHAPTQIFDDLTVSLNVELGSTQTYCVRAVNEVGYDSGYRSDPACKDVVIAWEAVVCGIAL
jgi:hypothetical protein